MTTLFTRKGLPVKLFLHLVQKSFPTLLCPDKMGCAWLLYWPFQCEIAGQGQPASLDEASVPSWQADGGRPPLGETGPVPLEPEA